MKLLKCHIENFGRLSNFDCTFNDDITTINKLNGWGKTTLAAFIKMMFYGMDATTKRKLDENDFKKYKPWQGGNYGGTLTFNLDGRNYRIERYYGAKATDESFELYNADTGMSSSDFTRSIGEEIFKINRDSYERSTYIPQQKLGTSATDSINSKLTNLVEAGDDLNNFDSACEKLNQKKRALKSTGGKGEIPELESQLIALRREVQLCEDAEETAVRIAATIKEKKEKKEELETELQGLKAAVKQANEYEKNQAELKLHDELLDNIKTKEEAFEKRAKFLNGRVPGDEDLEKYSALIEKIKAEKFVRNECDIDLKFKKEYQQLTDFFEGEMPSEATMAEMSEVAQRYEENKIRLDSIGFSENERFEKLNKCFGDGVPSEDTVEKCNENIAKMTELETNINFGKSELKVMTPSTNILGLVMFAIGVIALVTGVVLFVLEQQMIGGIAAGIGLVVAICSFIISKACKIKASKKVQEKKDAVNELQKQFDELDLEVREFIEKYSVNKMITVPPNDLAEIKANIITYNELKTARDAVEDRKNAILADINEDGEILESVLGRFSQKIGSNNFSQLVTFVTTNINIFKALQNRLEKDRAAEKILIEIEPELQRFLKFYFTKLDAPYEELLNEIKQNTMEYKRLKKELEEAKNKYDEYLEQNNVPNDIEEQNIVLPIEELEQKIKAIEEEIDAIKNDIYGSNGLETELNRKSIIAEEMSEKESEIERIEIELEEKNRKLFLIERTVELLAEAKDSLALGYLGGMNKGFEKYFSKINGEIFANSKLDVNLGLKIEELGKTRDVEAYSAGYKDLIGLCTRLALVEALFTEEKPFIILDDPFVNLDEDKIEKALQVVKDLAKDYQIIYLTCHSSREVV